MQHARHVRTLREMALSLDVDGKIILKAVLFLCGLFNDAISSLGNIVSYYRIITEH
jgi:hypothetical protein